MKNITLTLTGLQINADGSGVVLTKVSADNPSKTGVFRYSQGGLQRLASRAGVGNALALKHIATLGASIKMDVIECKAGDTWSNETTGEEGEYTRDHFQTRNEEIVFSPIASMKIAEMALQSIFSAPTIIQPTVQPISSSKDGSKDGSEDGSKEEEIVIVVADEQEEKVITTDEPVAKAVSKKK